MKPLVSIITVNYNESLVTMEFLESIRKLTYPNVEVIVVDNDSPNDDPDAIKTAFPEIQLIKSHENLGFAGGNNLGVKHS
ncbi:MAG: glycosyltransferase, partial [Bacteroidota bacterium]